MINLSEMVRLLKAHPERSLYIDIKKVDFHQLAAETVDVHPQLILASTKYDEIKLWRQVCPGRGPCTDGRSAQMDERRPQ